MKTLVLGGYGNFGARICRALASDPAIELLVGGRDLARSQAVAHELGSGARGVAIDLQASGFAEALRELEVGLVIRAAGPFQQQAYGVALAAASVGAHYIDLADGRRFVRDFAAALDRAFRAASRHSRFDGLRAASTWKAPPTVRCHPGPIVEIRTVGRAVARATIARSPTTKTPHANHQGHRSHDPPQDCGPSRQDA